MSEIESSRQRKRTEFFLAMSIAGVVFIVIFPFISVFIGLVLAASFAFHTDRAEALRPTSNIYSGLTSMEILTEEIVKEKAKIGEEPKTKNAKIRVDRKKFIKDIVPALAGFAIFIISILLMGLGFNGILFYLLS